MKPLIKWQMFMLPNPANGVQSRDKNLLFTRKLLVTVNVRRHTYGCRDGALPKPVGTYLKSASSKFVDNRQTSAPLPEAAHSKPRPTRLLRPASHPHEANPGRFTGCSPRPIRNVASNAVPVASKPNRGWSQLCIQSLRQER